MSTLLTHDEYCAIAQANHLTRLIHLLMASMYRLYPGIRWKRLTRLPAK